MGTSQMRDFVAVYRRYFPLLARKCARILREPEEALDVAQETFLRLHEGPMLSQDERAITAWLYRTSTRLAIDRLRQRARDGVVEAGHAHPLAVGPEQALHAQCMWKELLRLVPDAELEAAMLSRVDGLMQREVADVMGIHERSVRRLLSQFEARTDRLRSRNEV